MSNKEILSTIMNRMSKEEYTKAELECMARLRALPQDKAKVLLIMLGDLIATIESDMPSSSKTNIGLSLVNTLEDLIKM